MGISHPIGIIIVLLLMSVNVLGQPPGRQPKENTCMYPVATVYNDWCWSYIYNRHYPCSYSVYDVIESCCSGWTRTSGCTEMCEEGHYGYDCGDECDCDSGEGVCNKVDGSCGVPCGLMCHNNQHCNVETNGCECMPGWQGAECNLPCSNDTYGQNCGQACECENYVMCGNIDGQCICKPGWTGATCNMTCDVGFYGIQCEEICNCSTSDTCDPIDGTCTCPPGLYGDRCQTTCPAGFYGVNCSSSCLCDVKQECNPVTGECKDILTEVKTRKQDATKSLTLGVGISAIILFLIILLLGATVMLYKRSIRKRRGTMANVEHIGQTMGSHEISDIGLYTSVMRPGQTSTHGDENYTEVRPPKYYIVEPNNYENAEIARPPSVARHDYEEADSLTITNNPTEHDQSLDDDGGQYEMLRKELPNPQDEYNNLRTRPMATKNEEDSAYNVLQLKYPGETSTDYTITKPYSPGDNEPENTKCLQKETVGLNSSEINPPRTKTLVTSEADYALPIKPTRKKNTSDSLEKPEDLQDTKSTDDSGYERPENIEQNYATDYEDPVISHKNVDVNTHLFSDNDYSKLNRNVVCRNPDEVVGGDYEKLSKAAEFNESDEEYDTLRVVKKNPENTNFNTYDALQVGM